MRELPISPTTSASQLTAHSMCPRKYACSYIWGLEPEFRSTALITGSVVHAGIEWWFNEKLEGRIPTLDDLDRIIEADVLAATLDDETIRWKGGSAAELEVDAKRYVRAYVAACSDLPVKSMEAPFEVPLVDPDTGVVVGRDIRGFFDLVLADDRVVEIKTAAKGWREDDLARHLQVGAYAYVWSTLHGGPSQIEVHVIVKLKGTPRVERYTIERGEADTRWWLQAAAAIESAIASGNFPPSPSMLCNECEYQSACLKMVGEVSRVATDAARPRVVRHLEVVA